MAEDNQGAITQVRVVPLESSIPGRTLGRIALFNEDGSPFTGGGGGAVLNPRGEWDNTTEYEQGDVVDGWFDESQSSSLYWSYYATEDIPAGVEPGTDARWAILGATSRWNEILGMAFENLDSQFDTKADLVGGVVPTSQIPAIAIGKPFPVANRAAMLALTAEEGDVAIVASDTDGKRHTYMLGSGPASTFGSWFELGSAAAPVTSVNGQTDIVVLSKADIELANVDNTSDENKPISTATQAALNAKRSRITGIAPSNDDYLRIYATSADGTDTSVGSAKGVNGNVLARRNNDGTLDVAPGTGSTHSVTKAQLDAVSAAIIARKPGLNLRGVYDSTKAYVAGDVVTFTDGKVWVADRDIPVGEQPQAFVGTPPATPLVFGITPATEYYKNGETSWTARRAWRLDTGTAGTLTRSAYANGESVAVGITQANGSTNVSNPMGTSVALAANTTYYVYFNNGSNTVTLNYSGTLASPTAGWIALATAPDSQFVGDYNGANTYTQGQMVRRKGSIYKAKGPVPTGAAASYIGKTEFAFGAGNYTRAYPAGAAVGDVAVIVITGGNNSPYMSIATTGFDFLRAAAMTGLASVAVATKTLTSTDIANGFTLSGSGSNRYGGTMRVFRGVAQPDSSKYSAAAATSGTMAVAEPSGTTGADFVERFWAYQEGNDAVGGWSNANTYLDPSFRPSPAQYVVGASYVAPGLSPSPAAVQGVGSSSIGGVYGSIVLTGSDGFDVSKWDILSDDASLAQGSPRLAAVESGKRNALGSGSGYRAYTVTSAGVEQGQQIDAGAATVNTLALRDGSGRLKVADGVAADDAASRGQMDSAGALARGTSTSGDGGAITAGTTQHNAVLTANGSVTLPTATNHATSRFLLVRNTNTSGAVPTFTLTINRAGSDTIGPAGATTWTVPPVPGFVLLRSDGISRWDIVAGAGSSPDKVSNGVGNARVYVTDSSGNDSSLVYNRAAGTNTIVQRTTTGRGVFVPAAANGDAATFEQTVGHRPISGQFYTGVGISANGSRPAGFQTFHPFHLALAATFDRIGVFIATAGVAGSLLRFGIYADGGGKPGALILDAGTVSGETTGLALATISQLLPPGFYWLSTGVQGGVTSPTIPTFNGNFLMPGSAVRPGGSYNQGHGTGLSTLAATGGLPDNPSTNGGADVTFVTLLRAA